jgi:hypothetical protein
MLSHRVVEIVWFGILFHEYEYETVITCQYSLNVLFWDSVSVRCINIKLYKKSVNPCSVFSDIFSNKLSGLESNDIACWRRISGVDHDHYKFMNRMPVADNAHTDA